MVCACGVRVCVRYVRVVAFLRREAQVDFKLSQLSAALQAVQAQLARLVGKPVLEVIEQWRKQRLKQLVGGDAAPHAVAPGTLPTAAPATAAAAAAAGAGAVSHAGGPDAASTAGSSNNSNFSGGHGGGGGGDRSVVVGVAGGLAFLPPRRDVFIKPSVVGPGTSTATPMTSEASGAWKWTSWKPTRPPCR